MDNSRFDTTPYRLISRCPMCGSRATNARLEMLEETSEGTLVIYSRCGNCDIGLIASLSIMPQGMMGAAILTELDKQEVGKFAATQPISADEIMDYVRWLKKKS